MPLNNKQTIKMSTRTNHEIDYRIFGEEMQCVEIELDPQETVMAEAGAFMYKDQAIQMQTVLQYL